MTILDPTDVAIFSTSTSSVNSTFSFTYDVPESNSDQIISGEFKIVVAGSYMADSVRVFRVREYEMS